MPYLELSIDIYQEKRIPIDDDVFDHLADFLEQHYPGAWTCSVNFSDVEEPDKLFEELPLPGFDVT
jgi:uncharacterized protein YozE (UPF0346 family)